LFDHEFFDVYSYEEIPLNRDCYLMDEIYIEEYEKSWVNVFNGGDSEPYAVGFISHIAVRGINSNSIELSWYPNIYDRFHEVAISLPKEQFVTCVGCWRYDDDPHIFVKSAWLEEIHLRFYSVFGLIDAIGVKEALQKGELSRDKLILLRDEIDKLAKRYPMVSFISFADSVLIKSNWSVGHVHSEVKYTYKPEIFITIVKEFQSIYKNTLGLDVYAILTQGSNEYYEDSLLHISESKNHIGLNSLGIAFAELMSIDESVRSSIHEKIHEPSELYMDAQFYNSLNFKFEFQKSVRNNKNKYRRKMMGTDGIYYYCQFQDILDNLE